MLHEVFASSYNWLVANGLWKSAVGWGIGVALGAGTAWLPFRQHRKAQDQVIDLLRTDTPGGLATLIAAVEARNTASPEGDDHRAAS